MISLAQFQKKIKQKMQPESCIRINFQLVTRGNAENGVVFKGNDILKNALSAKVPFTS